MEGYPYSKPQPCRIPGKSANIGELFSDLSDSMTICHARARGPVASSFTMSVIQKERDGIATGLIPRERWSQNPQPISPMSQARNPRPKNSPVQCLLTGALRSEPMAV